MIKFSKREDYTVILLNDLAKNYNKKIVPLSAIAKKYNISILFLRNLALDLRTHNIIKAVEGKNGGYFLEKDPKKLKMGEILEAVNQRPLLLCCPTGTRHKGACPKESFCGAGKVWRKLNQEFLDKVSNLTLEEFSNYT